MSEIALFAAEAVAVRDAGFTVEALQYPRDELGLRALCAFNGCSIEQAPRGWRYYPNEGVKKQWERVTEALASRNCYSCGKPMSRNCAQCQKDWES